MADSSLELAILAWLATYALHSTALLGLAWIVTSRLGAERVKQLVWRVALVGGLVTASFQSLTPIPGAGRTDLARWMPASQETTSFAADAAPPGPVPLALAEPRALDVDALLATLVPERRFPVLAIAGWLVGGALIVALFAVARMRLSRELIGAKRLSEGPTLAMLEDLRLRAGVRRRVRLAVAPRLRGPIATGVFRPQIFLPPRAITDLDADLQRAMLGHELAHIARFDPLWLGLCRILETAFFFQPLNRLARRRLSECAEYLCDEDAVTYTGDRLGLARCLAEVAAWIVARSRPVPACGMADKRSPLGLRVERILDTQRRDSRPQWVVPMLTLALGTTILYAPGFSAHATEIDRAFGSMAPARAPLTTERATDALVEPARPPIARTTVPPVSPLAALAAELAEIDVQGRTVAASVDELRMLAAGRRVSPALAGRIRAVERRADLMNRRLEQLRALSAQLERIQRENQEDR
ncbi:MAG: M56 family metallopeptidase [bacterium]|nr:M56 family metallopeptidase [bacterium]